MFRSPGDPAAPSRRRPAVVERDAALAQLNEARRRAERGQRTLLLLVGPAGLGKTTLLEAFLAEQAHDAALLVGRGECVEHYGPGEPYLPVLDAPGRLGRGPAGPLVVRTLYRCAPLWLRQLPALIEPEQHAELERRTKDATPARMLREMTEALEVLCQERTLLLSFEDLHWCDPSTCSLLMFLARRREPARLLIVGTLRSDEAPDYVKQFARELRAQRWATELALAPLSPEGVRRYLEARLAHPPHPELVSQLMERTQGHPLFLSRLADALVQRAAGSCSEQAGGSGRPEASADELPETLRGFALKRVETLEPGLRSVLELGSVAGSEFCAAEIAEALGVPLEQAEQRCSELARHSQLVEACGVRQWPNGTVSASYRYAHSLLHEAVYASIEAGRRVRLHRQLGDALERGWAERSGEIAASLRLHYEAAHDVPRAVRFAEQAARLALSRNAPQEALGHLRSALAMLDEASERDARRELSLRLLLGTALLAGSGWTAPEVLDNYTRARELCEELGATRELPAVLRGLLVYYQVQGRLSLARAHGERLLAVCSGQRAASAQAHAAHASTLVLLGDSASALHHACAALAEYRPGDAIEHAELYGGHDPAVAALSWAGLALWNLGWPAEGHAAADLAMRVAERQGHDFSACFARYMASRVLELSGRTPEARALLAVAFELAERDHHVLMQGLAGAAWIATRARQRPIEASHRLHAAVHEHEEQGARYALPQLLGLLGQVEARAGLYDEAESALQRAVEVATHTGQHVYLPWLFVTRAELAAQRRATSSPGEQPAELAEVWLERALEVARQQDARSWLVRVAWRLAQLWDERGERARAAALLGEATADFSDEGPEPELGLARGALRAWVGAASGPLLEPKHGALVEAWRAQRERARELAEGRATSMAVGAVEAASGRAGEAHAPVLEEVDSARLVREGEYWTVQYKGQICRVKEARGMELLARLLALPYREVHVLDLAADPAPDEDLAANPAAIARALGAVTGLPALDRAARVQYQKRVAELRSELEEARQHHDTGRAEQLLHELEALEGELSRATGLSGRRRPSGSPSERARVNVTRALKGVIRRIAEHHPVLGDHLSRALRTGTFCSYAPEPRDAVSWHIEEARPRAGA